jgi:hypothetical protein
VPWHAGGLCKLLADTPNEALSNSILPMSSNSKEC